MQAGDTLGPYHVSGKLGEGGMGAVFRARDTRLGRDVALKLLPDSFSQEPDRVARFAREAQVLASLNHPNVATIYGLERLDHHQVIVMELVDGETLEARLGAGRSRSKTRAGLGCKSPRRSTPRTNVASSIAI